MRETYTHLIDRRYISGWWQSSLRHAEWVWRVSLVLCNEGAEQFIGFVFVFCFFICFCLTMKKREKERRTEIYSCAHGNSTMNNSFEIMPENKKIRLKKHRRTEGTYGHSEFLIEGLKGIHTWTAIFNFSPTIWNTSLTQSGAEPTRKACDY